MTPPLRQRLDYGSSAEQFGDLWIPRSDSDWPLVIALHGGYWRRENDLAHMGHLCEALRDAGNAVFSLEYRRLGMAGIGASEMLADVTAGIEFASRSSESWGCNTSRPVLLGHSAGGHLALLSARAGTVSGVLALAPLSDLAAAQSLRLSDGVVNELVLQSAHSGLSLNDMSPIERAPVGVPLIVIHGGADKSVPVAMSVRYADVARKRGDVVELVVVEGAAHMDLVDPGSTAFPHVRDAVVRLRTGA